MAKITMLVLSMGLTIGATVAVAEDGQQSAFRLVIVGIDDGEGRFTDVSAISISAGSGASAIGGYVADPASGAIGTAVAVGQSGDDLTDRLPGFNTSSPSPYETVVCSTDSCTEPVDTVEEN